MRGLRIVPRYTATVSPDELERVERLAEALRREHPELAHAGSFARLAPQRLESAPTLHVDDLSEIQMLGPASELAFIADRARLRAVRGDLVASTARPVEGFEAYCEERLGLGAVTWLRPRVERDPIRPALSCWIDRDVRRELVRAARSAGLLYVHPHMGCFAAWALAHLVQSASRRRVEVIAPPPALTRKVNDKVWFSRVVGRLLGRACVPYTLQASNLATLAQVVRTLAARCQRFVVKLPDSAGGEGNLLLEAAPFRRAPLGEIRRRLRESTERLGWHGEQRLLVSLWEERVLRSLSSQLWIRPRPEGPPVVEGLFEQTLEGPACHFVGSRPARAPHAIEREVLDKSWLLARLFQSLGYVGRCSFDTVVVGRRLDAARVRFVECNGRWGGSSAPMTLANRLLGDHRARPWAVREVRVPGLARVRFRELLAALGGRLFDVRAGKGSVVLFNPGALRAREAVYSLVLGTSDDEVTRAVDHELPALLRALVPRLGARSA